MVDRWIDDAVVFRTVAAEMGQLSVQFVATFVLHNLIHLRAVTGAPTLGRPYPVSPCRAQMQPRRRYQQDPVPWDGANRYSKLI